MVVRAYIGHPTAAAAGVSIEMGDEERAFILIPDTTAQTIKCIRIVPPQWYDFIRTGSTPIGAIIGAAGGAASGAASGALGGRAVAGAVAGAVGAVGGAAVGTIINRAAGPLGHADKKTAFQLFEGLGGVRLHIGNDVYHPWANPDTYASFYALYAIWKVFLSPAPSLPTTHQISAPPLTFYMPTAWLLEAAAARAARARRDQFFNSVFPTGVATFIGGTTFEISAVTPCEHAAQLERIRKGMQVWLDGIIKDGEAITYCTVNARADGWTQAAYTYWFDITGLLHKITDAVCTLEPISTPAAKLQTWARVAAHHQIASPTPTDNGLFKALEPDPSWTDSIPRLSVLQRSELAHAPLFEGKKSFFWQCYLNDVGGSASNEITIPLFKLRANTEEESGHPPPTEAVLRFWFVPDTLPDASKPGGFISAFQNRGGDLDLERCGRGFALAVEFLLERYIAPIHGRNYGHATAREAVMQWHGNVDKSDAIFNAIRAVSLMLLAER